MLIKLNKENYEELIIKMSLDERFVSNNIFLFHQHYLSINDIKTYAYNNDIILNIIESDISKDYYEIKYITKFD